jgi:hypothetical protein
MWQTIEVVLRRLDEWRCRRNVRRALALHHRGEARPDGLQLLRVRNRLEIRWRARDIHPWDADVTPGHRSELFHEQLIADTEAAILRLFQALPQIDRIDLKVLDPADVVVLAGTVHRSALQKVQTVMSVRMRLLQLGVNFSPLDSPR